jgi:hypothetical protein
MSETVTVDSELARQALDDVLDADAAKQPAAAPPPRRVIEGATPDAPWGFKGDGTPRKGPPGPGRPRKDKAADPRTEPPGTPGQEAGKSQAVEPVTYAQQVNDALMLGWIVMASVPPVRPQAAILHDGIPGMVPAWDKAAQQNTTVRKYVLKLSGEGSWAWIVPVVLTTLPVVLGMWQATIAGPEIRKQLAGQTQIDLQAFLVEQAQAAGITIETQTSSSAAPDVSQPPAMPSEQAA